jgi:DNA-binding ferritin-like protein
MEFIFRTNQKEYAMKKGFNFPAQKVKLIFGILVFLFSAVNPVNAQVANVEQTLSELKENVSRMNQLAESHEIYKAVELLNSTRRDFDSYVSHYFDDEFRAARKENSAYSPEISLQFSSKLGAAYWEGRVKRSQRAIDNAKEAFAARNYQRTLNAQDEVWAYLETAYTVANTIKDVAENIITQDYVEAAKSAYDGANDFIENYKNIEEARLQIINTDRYEIEVQTLIKRAEKMEETNWQFSSYMRAWEQDVDDFYRLFDRFNTRVKTLGNEALTEWSDFDYNWDSKSFLLQIETLGNQFKTNSQNYESVKKQIQNIISQAENQKEEVEKNISATNSPEKFDKINKLEEDFDEFYNLAIDVVDECYRVSQSKTTVQSENQSAVSSNQNMAGQKTNSQNVSVNSNSVNNPIGLVAGNRIPNAYFHSYWSDSRGNKIKFRQNGQSVEIEGAGVGQIQHGVLVYSYVENDGTRRKNEYRLLDDGFKMEVKKEWSDMMIKDHLTIQNNFTAPSQEKIDEFRKTNDNFITSVLSYAGSTMAMYGDTDRDQVPNDFDNCPDTPQGLTVSNGGVDITGCPVNSNLETNTALDSSAEDANSSENRSENNQTRGNKSTSTKVQVAHGGNSLHQTSVSAGNQTTEKVTTESPGLFKNVTGGFKMIGIKNR